MKSGAKAFLIIGIFIAVSVAISVSGGAGQFKARTENGVMIVTNGRKPSPPLGAPTKLVLEEIYTAGGGNSPEESFVEAVAVDVSKDGTAYVLDMKDNKVKVFDAQGKFLRAFGKKGQGPGEFNLPEGLIITRDNEVVVQDTRSQRLVLFTPEGRYLKNISTAKTVGISEIKVDGGGLIVGRSISSFGDTGKWLVSVKAYDKDYNLKFTLAAFEIFSPLLLGRLNPFSAIALNYALDGQGHLYLGSQSGYEINFLSLEGKLLKTIGRDYDPIPITKGDQDGMLKAWNVKVRDSVQFPEVYPPYANFVVADEGRLLVRTYEKGKAQKEFYWDVFDADGRYIAKVPMVGQIRLWRDGRVYFFVENEDGYKVLKCYRARWEK